MIVGVEDGNFLGSLYLSSVQQEKMLLYYKGVYKVHWNSSSCGC